MSAPDPIADPAVAIQGAQPFWIGPPERPRFAWLHRPATPLGIGLVIVPPFGYEAICAHRALRHLAESAATAGAVAIRIDLDGTGDSAGTDLDRGRLDAWLASLDDACALARSAGCDRIVLAGIRLGATLATLAAARRDDVAGLVAVAAVPSGKAVVREAKLLQMALGLPAAPPGVAAPAPELQEIVGFALTSEARTALAQTDLVAAQRRPAPAVLIIDRDDLPGNDAWAARLAELGAAVTRERLPGYVEMVLDPHKAEVPTAIIAAIVAFATSLRATTGTGRPTSPTPSARVEIPLAGGVTIVEEAITLDHGLFGMVSRQELPARRAVILLNAGAVGRIGPNRLHVALARRLAARGDLVLRLDLSGLGDSRPRRGAAENVVYSEHALDDVAVAVAWARRVGAIEIVVAGLCSGAYHAFKAAVAGQPIDTVIAINPLTFFWKPGMSLDFAAFRVTGESQRYQKSALSLSSWRKLLRGDVDVARVARIVGHRARAIAEHRARDLARRLRVPMHDDLGSELLALGRADVAMHFVFAGDDPGHSMLLEHGGSAVPRLVAAGKLAVHIIPGPDHTFTPRWSHELLLRAITAAAS